MEERESKRGLGRTPVPLLLAPRPPVLPGGVILPVGVGNTKTAGAGRLGPEVGAVNVAGGNIPLGSAPGPPTDIL